MTAGGTATPQHPEPSAGAAPLAAAPQHPEPPAGPGVAPPFVAPPTDGVRKRRWLALGLGGAAALLCCVGVLFGFGGLVVFGSQMVLDQSRAAVTEYLTAVRDENYAQAYQLLCDTRRATTRLPEFERSFTGPPMVSFTVGEPVLTETITVPATLHFDDGSSQLVRFLLEQDATTGEFEVCGEAD